MVSRYVRGPALRLQAMVCACEQRIVVAFRGTDNLANVYTDLSLFRTVLDIESPFGKPNLVLVCAPSTCLPVMPHSPPSAQLSPVTATVTVTACRF